MNGSQSHDLGLCKTGKTSYTTRLCNALWQLYNTPINSLHYARYYITWLGWALYKGCRTEERGDCAGLELSDVLTRRLAEVELWLRWGKTHADLETVYHWITLHWIHCRTAYTNVCNQNSTRTQSDFLFLCSWAINTCKCNHMCNDYTL